MTQQQGQVLISYFKGTESVPQRGQETFFQDYIHQEATWLRTLLVNALLGLKHIVQESAPDMSII